MEPELSHANRPEPPPRNELRALVQLRERVEAAAREVERLREENAALAARVAELQAPGATSAAATGAGAATVLPGGEEPEKLKARLQGFIDAIDQVLSAPEPADAVRRQNG
jgi:hypothetical protein